MESARPEASDQHRTVLYNPPEPRQYQHRQQLERKARRGIRLNLWYLDLAAPGATRRASRSTTATSSTSTKAGSAARSPAPAAGRARPGPPLTWARADSSNHNAHVYGSDEVRRLSWLCQIAWKPAWACLPSAGPTPSGRRDRPAAAVEEQPAPAYVVDLSGVAELQMLKNRQGWRTPNRRGRDGAAIKLAPTVQAGYQ